MYTGGFSSRPSMSRLRARLLGWLLLHARRMMTITTAETSSVANTTATRTDELTTVCSRLHCFVLVGT